MKNIIKKLLRENLQLADKFYFNTGKLSSDVKKIILSITKGDVYTKIITDLYYEMLMQNNIELNMALKAIDKTHIETEKPESDILNIYEIKKLIPIYFQLKEYNKNVFPIKDFNINGVKNNTDLLKALTNRAKIIDIFSTWPSIAKRNLKQDIRMERNGYEMHSFLQDLEYADAHISQLNNRNETAKNKILSKIFTKNTTLDNVINFIQEKNTLLGGTDLNRKQVSQILKYDKENYDELKVKYNKGNIMIIEVSGPDGIKLIGCNSLWCFTYNKKGGEINWHDWYENTTNDYCYIIIDFSQPSDSEEFMYVLTKPLLYDYSDYQGDSGRLYDMANRDMGDSGNNIYDSYINQIIGRLIDLPTAMKVMNFGIKPPKEKKKKQKFVDPNQLALDLNEIKKSLRNFFI